MSHLPVITVFLSYSQKDRILKETIEEELSDLCGENIKFVSDVLASRGEPLHKEISRLINRCDIMIPIITHNWLTSHETRDELIRANERRRYIIPFLKSDDGDRITTEDLPHYIRDILRIHFKDENFKEKLLELADKVNNFEDHWKKKAFEEIRKVGDYLTLYEKPKNRQKEYALQEIRLLGEDLKKIFMQDQYKKNVSYESNFLTQAIPFFKTAQTIYAVSFIKISSFWTSTTTRDAVVTYLREQSTGTDKKVCRLFVFETPDEANDFKNILDANYSYYGQKGGIFICSMDTYKDLLKSMGDDLGERLRNDFGILQYEGDEYYEATLDPRDFYIGRVDLERSRFYRNFTSFMEQLMLLGEGDFYQKSVVRWTRLYTLSGNTELWSKTLEELFSERTGKVTHIVMFKLNNRKEEVFRALLNVKDILGKQKKNKFFEMLDINVLSTIGNVDGVDGRFKSLLKINQDHDYAIIESFPSKDDLENYYRNEIHSTERQKLYEVINPKVKQYFKRLNFLLEKRDTAGVRETYAKIEDEMSRYVIRIDFRDEYPIDYIAHQDGIEFEKFR